MAEPSSSDPSGAYVQPSARLTAAGALAVVEAARRKAEEIGVPQCIAVVDAGGQLVSFLRMDGAKPLSQHSATAKAMTAASSRAPSGGMDPEIALRLSVATGGRLLNVPGGLPLTVDGEVVGAIGIGSGTPDQDVQVAQAGADALTGAVPS